jgi:hypothetical protein
MLIVASMVIDQFNLVGVAILPIETNPVLFVDSNAVLPLSISLEFFQTIAGRNSQVF